MAVPPLDDFKTYPRMVRWFNPVLLYKLLNNVVTSAMFGQYADRRLVVAALDTVDAKEHFRRAEALRTEKILQPNGNDAVWFDFVADLGDGFDSTYAVASLLASKNLTFGKTKLPRGQFLLMGGDEVYPLASKQTYDNQLKQPYKWASLDPDRAADEGVPMFAIPGNHDWYDGLVLFLAHFCREKPSHFGSWRSRQRRSYFAIRLTETWWIWAIDIQLAEDMDQPQADYFVNIAKEMDDNSRIILCAAEPGWLYTDTNTQSWEIMGFAIGLASKAGKNFTIPILLSGDTHHYSRYVAKDGTQFITSGGGGAFLHPTHQLEDDVTVNWLGKDRQLELARINDVADQLPAVYPSTEISRDLVWGNWKFALLNWDFSLLMGAIYFVVGIVIGLRDAWDAYLIVAGLMALGLFTYALDQEKVSPLATIKNRLKLKKVFKVNVAKEPDRKQHFEEKLQLDLVKNGKKLTKAMIVVVATLAHASLQAFAAVYGAHLFAQINDGLVFSGTYHMWSWLLVLAGQTIPLGFLIGSTLFGVNMLLTCRYLRMNRNDAFSALRIGRFNNFLRIKIEGDTAQINVVGLENVPSRDDWIDNPKRKTAFEPNFIPKPGTELEPHIVETIIVKGSVTPV